MTNTSLHIFHYVLIATALITSVPSCLSFILPPLSISLSARKRPWRFATTASSPTWANSPPSMMTASAKLDPEVARLKDDLVAIAATTRRGFSATPSDREKVKNIISDLTLLSPSEQPAAAYYAGEDRSSDVRGSATIAGKWTLIYTDAPDITSLDGGPFATAKLGKIGQECSPPYITNVIEWKRPDWAASLPLSGSDSSRVLQKVCCEAKANENEPKFVDLKLAGLELNGANGDENAGNDSEGESQSSPNFLSGPGGFLKEFPIDLRGPLKLPFGRFEILFLDSDLRIIRTNQGFTSVNIREYNEWF